MLKKTNKKIFQGVVTSTKMDKTAVVEVERRFIHRRYGKTVKRTTKFYLHDPKNECKIGDVVQIIESRPLSRLKRWQLLKIIESKGKDNK